MNVWCMNLKDNRNKETRKKSIKARQCFDDKILAVGWVDVSAENAADYFQQLTEHYKNDIKELRKIRETFNALNSIKKGDLVWVYNPHDKKYYIVRIRDETLKLHKENKYKAKDISVYIEFDKCICVGNSIELNKYIDYRRILSRRVLRSCKKEDVIAITQKIFEEMYEK